MFGRENRDGKLYQFQEDFSRTQRFNFRKKLIENMNWGCLSTAAQAVWPVIACYANRDTGICFPGEFTIRALSGIMEKYVRKGIHGLAGFPGFSWQHYTAKTGRRSKKFCLDLPANHIEKETFPFFKCVLESGVWSQLLPTGRALYPVMRYFGYFDIESYMELEEGDYEAKDFNEIFESRTWDICEAEKIVMAEYAGIDRRSVNAALTDLERCGLVERFSDRIGWKVYIKNKVFFHRSYLNKKLHGKK